MSKLLRAEYARMFQSKVFRFSVVICVVYALFVFAVGYHNVITYGNIDEVMFEESFVYTYGFYGLLPVPGILMAVFTCLFLGTEYDEGTIRNKLVVGHSRGRIYLTGFLCLSGMGLIMQLCTAVTLCLVGIPAFGFFQMPAAWLMELIVNGIFMVISYAAAFNLLSAVLQNKTAIGIVGLLTLLCCLIIFTYLRSRLIEPPMQEMWDYVAGEGTEELKMAVEMAVNPRYLEGVPRSVCEMVLNLFPTGQSIQLSDIGGFHGWILTIYSIIVTFIANVAGLLHFRRRDMR